MSDTLTLHRVPQTLGERAKPIGDEKPMVFVDLETTGLDPNKEKIIEIGMVRCLYSPSANLITSVESAVSLYQDPGRPISEFITKLTGITDEKVKGQRISRRTVASFLQGNPLMVAHNAGFDRRFFEVEFPGTYLLWACSSLDPDWRDLGFEGIKLEYLVFKHGYFYEGHRAETDCWALSLLLERNPEALRRIVAAPGIDRYLIKATGAPFELKGTLRKCGFKWNADEKTWQLKTTDPDLSRFPDIPEAVAKKFTTIKLDPRKRFLL
jgi:DNA polymerase-3 subunit epsilon